MNNGNHSLQIPVHARAPDRGKEPDITAMITLKHRFSNLSGNVARELQS